MIQLLNQESYTIFEKKIRLNQSSDYYYESEIMPGSYNFTLRPSNNSNIHGSKITINLTSTSNLFELKSENNYRLLKSVGQSDEALIKSQSPAIIIQV